MKQISEFIYSYFLGLTAFTDIVSDRFFPLVADKKTAFPLSIYSLTQQNGLTKDMDGFNVLLSVYFKQAKYDDAVKFSDTLTDIVKNENKFEWQNSEVSFIEENQSHVVSITFNI